MHAYLQLTKLYTHAQTHTTIKNFYPKNPLETRNFTFTIYPPCTAIHLHKSTGVDTQNYHPTAPRPQIKKVANFAVTLSLSCLPQLSLTLQRPSFCLPSSNNYLPKLCAYTRYTTEGEGANENPRKNRLARERFPNSGTINASREALIVRPRAHDVNKRVIILGLISRVGLRGLFTALGAVTFFHPPRGGGEKEKTEEALRATYHPLTRFYRRYLRLLLLPANGLCARASLSFSLSPLLPRVMCACV